MNYFYKTNGAVGSSVFFWAIDGKGYTSNIDHAEIYSQQEMQDEVDKGYLRDNDEFPLCVEHVDALSEWRVNCQYLTKFYPEHKDPNNEYVAYKSNCWDGDDLAFSNGVSGWDFDYSKASVFKEKDILPYVEVGNKKMYFVPKSHADEMARRTFQKQNINRRKMIVSAGITGVRKKRASKATGKNRFNCSCCGKIIWEFAHSSEELQCSECQLNRSFSSPVIGCY